MAAKVQGGGPLRSTGLPWVSSPKGACGCDQRSGKPRPGSLLLNHWLPLALEACPIPSGTEFCCVCLSGCHGIVVNLAMSLECIGTSQGDVLSFQGAGMCAKQKHITKRPIFPLSAKHRVCLPCITGDDQALLQSWLGHIRIRSQVILSASRCSACAPE